MTKIVSIYARVSSETQAQNDTISSQINSLENRVRADGHELIDEFKFIDNGYSGSNLTRPALEKLRDRVSEGEIDKVYIHSPDRLSRKYAYQMILLEEFQKYGTEIIFLNHQTNDSPESNLLLQVQGVIAEYEREKIMERNRRGKLHAAKRGSINVLGGAPYGYNYIDKYAGNGQAFYEINAQQAEVVQKIFCWMGQERVSLGEICRRLKKIGILSSTGKSHWDKRVVWGVLTNPAYKGQAAFGKTKIVTKTPCLRHPKGSSGFPKHNYSINRIEKENWIYIPVPAIIDEALFESAQEQLEENKKFARIGRREVGFLLQGLVVCKSCGYAYYGKRARSNKGKRIDHYAYYRCIGSDAYRFGGNKICNNKQVRTDTLEIAIWEEVKYLLKNPDRILEEYQQRVLKLEKSPLDKTKDSLEKQKNKLKRGISRLIDSYAQEYINREEFEPRIKEMKQRLETIEEQNKKIK